MSAKKIQVRAVSLCYQQWVEDSIFNLGHFHFNFDVNSPWQVEVAFYGGNPEGYNAPSCYLFGRDILMKPFKEPPEDKDVRHVFAVSLPSSEVTIIHFKDFESNTFYPYCFPTCVVSNFVEQTLMVASKEREEEIWALQMEAEWAVFEESCKEFTE